MIGVGDANPSVGDGKFQLDVVRRVIRGPHAKHDVPFLRELDRVADQVGQNLPQAQRIANEPVGQRGRQVAGQFEPLFVRPNGQRLDRLVERSRRLKGPGSSTNFPASMREKSKISLNSESSTSAELRTVCR